MNLTIADIHQKLQQINISVKEDLKRKGIAVPKKNKDGSISVGQFRIIKDQQHFKILDYSGEILYQGINLPQTAAVLANELATKHFINKQILESDRKYGHAAFEEEYQHRLLSKKTANQNFKDIIRCKVDMAKIKKEFYRTEIENGFKKLVSIR